MDWNALQYLKFEKERTQPSIDLIKRIDNCPKTIIDLGSGPGNSTNQLKKHFNDSSIIGVDISDKMLEKARLTYPDIEFKKCVLPYDLNIMMNKLYDMVMSYCYCGVEKNAPMVSDRLFELLDVVIKAGIELPTVDNFYKYEYTYGGWGDHIAKEDFYTI